MEKEIIVKAYEYDEGILIEFIDNGIGIESREYRENLQSLLYF